MKGSVKVDPPTVIRALMREFLVAVRARIGLRIIFDLLPVTLGDPQHVVTSSPYFPG
jgi:hypothetical protein